MEIWTGFIVGLAGSLHCIGMCGPIAFALPVANQSNFKIMLGRVLYNLGRVVTYSLLGALFGLFGSRLVLFGLQQQLSIGFGVIILLYVFTPRKIKTKVADTFFYKHATQLLKSQFAKLLSANSNSSMFAIGLLNGLLPCGFVYVGIAGAVSTGDFLSGIIYMALFGFGTFPAMFAASVFGKFINLNLKRKINRFVPVLAAVLAILFILRGMNLGIPFVSPKFVKAASIQQETCH